MKRFIFIFKNDEYISIFFFVSGEIDKSIIFKLHCNEIDIIYRELNVYLLKPFAIRLSM